MDVSYITDDSLFLKLPVVTQEARPTIEDLLNDLERSKEDYDSMIDKTYYIIKQQELGWDQVLKVWEIRLTLHLWWNQLGRARKEGVNLNNGIYQSSVAQAKSLQEKSGVIQPSSTLQNSPSMTSLGLVTSVRQVPGLQPNSNTPAPSYPLPKHLSLRHSLLILLLRLKSLPNMNLVNEYYKLTYQLRLKSTPLSRDDLAMKLINLSYDIIVILIVTKNYTTLVSYLTSIRHELLVLGKLSGSELDTQYQQYLSNLALMLVLCELLADNYFKTPTTDTVVKYTPIFDEVNDISKNSLRYVLQNIYPSVGTRGKTQIQENQLSIDEDYDDKETSTIENDQKPVDPLDGSPLELSNIVQLIESGALSTRIICSTLGLWDIATSNDKLVISENGIHLEESDQQTDDEDLIQKSINLISTNWHKYVYKVYGLE